MTQRAAPDGTSTPVDTGTIPALDEDQLRGPMLDRLLLDGGTDCYKPPIRAHRHDSFGTGTGCRTSTRLLVCRVRREVARIESTRKIGGWVDDVERVSGPCSMTCPHPDVRGP